MSVYLSQSCLTLQEWACQDQVPSLKEQGLSLKMMGTSITLMAAGDLSDAFDG